MTDTNLSSDCALSTQALNSAAVQRGMLDILLDHAKLHESLRARAA